MAKFIRNCECGEKIRFTDLAKTLTCPSCGTNVSVKSGRSEIEQDQTVTISPLID